VLRPSRELAWTPVPHVASTPASAAATAGTNAAEGGEPAAIPAPALPAWILVGASVAAGLGWLLERRRRRLLETEKDSVLWAHVQPAGSSIVTEVHDMDDILPDGGPTPAEAARAIYVTAISETSSRREATLIDLHQLQSKLARRTRRGDTNAAVLLLQEHLVDFRYTSPWVFLELLELYRQLGREKEWEVARRAFRARFGQNAPAWEAPSTEGEGLCDDEQLCEEFLRQWPYREARLVTSHWMLGEHEMRQDCSGPPLLGLGVYREMMLLDSVLDDVMDNRTEPAESIL